MRLNWISLVGSDNTLPDESYTTDFGINQSDGILTVRVPGKNVLRLALTDIVSIQQLVAAFVLKAEDLRSTHLKTFRVEEDEAIKFLRRMKSAAFTCLVNAIDEEYRHFNLLLDRLYWSIGLARARGRPLMVEIVSSSGSYLPWEWLAVPDHGVDLIDEARSILAFSGIVWRRLTYSSVGQNVGAPMGSESHPSIGHPIRVRMFRDQNLGGASAEFDYFSLTPGFELVSAGPPDDEDAEGIIAKHLADPALNDTADTPYTRPEQIVHISCHHGLDVDVDTATASELRSAKLVLHFGTTARVKLSELGGAIAAELYHLHPLPAHMPIVFLNVCNGAVYPFQGENAVAIFSKNRNPGVVTTSMEVPDAIAAEVSERFYRSVIQGQGAARSLWLARVNLLRGRLGNPIGMLYCYYGNPEIYVGAGKPPPIIRDVQL